MNILKGRKKSISVFLLVLSIILISTNVFAEPVRIMVKNEYIDMPVDPIIKEGRTLVPLRAIFESLGADVEWEQSTQTVTGKLNDTIIKLQINNKLASVNGSEVTLDVPATINNGRTLVPVRFIGESLGAKVDYKNGIVLINSDAPIKKELSKFPKYKVVRVVDGDTIIISMNGKDERLRLIGVDTPESVHPDSSKNIPEGKIASDYVKELIEGKEVGVEFDVQERDKYGRLLAYVYSGDMMLNKHLLEEGYARLSTFPPNVKYVDDFTKIQTKSREGNKGFWKNGVHSQDGNHKDKNSEQQRKLSGKFIGSIQSDKFHKPTCRWAKSIKSHNETWFSDVNDALNQGYSPCGVCRP